MSRFSLIGNDARRPTRSRGRRVLFRVLALGLSLLPLLLLEWLCVAAGWGQPDLSHDPFVEFAAVRPLFQKDASGEWFETADDRLGLFVRDRFAATKTTEQRRIFCLGGSTVQGEPYSIETAFPRWLQIVLHTIDPSHKWEVVNCGGLSYASYRLVPILEEVLRYDPDLIIICTGHNEFLEDRSYQSVKGRPRKLNELFSWLSRRRLTNLLGRVINGRQTDDLHGHTTTLPAEVVAMLDYENGTAAYHWDPDWHRGVAEHYRYNLFRMIELCRAVAVPVILLKPCSNLGHHPPFKSEHRAGLSAAEMQEWEEAVAAAHAAYSLGLDQAIRHLQRAIAIDPQYALTWFELGQALVGQAKFGSAREALIAARDRDVCPLRMTTALEEIWQEVIEATAVPHLDLQSLFEARVPGEILGSQWLVDHIHPDIEGHQLIAVSLVPLLTDLDLIVVPVVWEPEARHRFQQHFAELDRSYFHRGNRKLEGLKAWATGRAQGPPVESQYPHRIGTEQSSSSATNDSPE